MSVSSIDVTLFRRMVINGAINLKNNSDEVDRLNVFPVPDGDTGTNMSLTVTSGIRELEACESSSIIDNAKVLSRGALMGARGNSGVILSQFFRGIYVGLKELSHNYLSIDDFINCLQSGREIAYKAVMEPVEGTILTVIRESTEAIKNSKFNTIDELLACYLETAHKSLENTPNLLPVLKEAGVVDSGGAGFVKIIEGMNLALKGEILVASNDTQVSQEAKVEQIDIKFLYSIDFVLELKKPDKFVERELSAALSLLGDSLSVTREDNKVKAHINTNRPGRAIEISQKQGEFLSLTIDNRKVQIANKNVAEAPAPAKVEAKKDFALVAVCFGEGIVSTFKELGVDYVIEGGQTMNPSTEAFVEAIKTVNAKNVIIIPNNSNVIMAANQAASMVKGVNVAVLKAKTIAQGYASLVNYNPEAGLDENVEAMTAQIENVTSGELTYSIRDTEIKGVKIKSGDYMGISNGQIIVSTAKKDDALKDLLGKIITEESAVVTLFCGKDVTKDEMDNAESMCLELNPDIDVELIDGKQDIYSYIIAVE
ncbi:MAG: DAK2 domain-containing protein [Acholeplasmatales bacterium]|nr:DAK2 domain-containing protein [Acholeplasmatales bacterium]